MTGRTLLLFLTGVSAQSDLLVSSTAALYQGLTAARAGSTSTLVLSPGVYDIASEIVLDFTVAIVAAAAGTVAPLLPSYFGLVLRRKLCDQGLHRLIEMG